MGVSTLLRCGAGLAAVRRQTGLGTAAAPQNAAFMVIWAKQPLCPVVFLGSKSLIGRKCPIESYRKYRPRVVMMSIHFPFYPRGRRAAAEPGRAAWLL